MSGPGGWWQGKSTPAKVETYTRWSFHFFALIEVVSIGLPLFSNVSGTLPWFLFPLVCAHSVLCAATASRALDWARGTRERPRRMLIALAAATALVAVVALTLSGTDWRPATDAEVRLGASMFVGVIAFGTGTLALGTRDRRRMTHVVFGATVGAGAASFPLGFPGPAALITAATVLLAAGFLTFTAAFSVWLLDAVYALDAARETRARLAVAEERLRFGRDLHDVMGRNLAVIALKSELAVQLARRGRPEAVDQMTEVQRLARESQREVREVVRGYREADLAVELAGAQGVLKAAGITCEVTGSTAGLPAQVQSALAWVVREATTNVLRHGDARRCGVSLRVTEGRVVLTVENDGVPDAATAAPRAEAGARPGGEDAGRGGGSRPEGASGTGAGPRPGGGTGTGGRTGTGRGTGTVGGSGLVGLRERLTALDGTLRAGPADGGTFRLTVEVPMPDRPGPEAHLPDRNPPGPELSGPRPPEPGPSEPSEPSEPSGPSGPSGPMPGPSAVPLSRRVNEVGS
ncbi:sensor histidine kinase [Streptomyces sp. NPDC088736]|uniref:sensor histidine kinase n=1 Tax=Streptomyces sp. NPDC088736 TaxID=3365881 RepID=UPI00382F82BB